MARKSKKKNRKKNKQKNIIRGGKSVETGLAMEELMRASVISPTEYRPHQGTIILPDETKFTGFREITLQDLQALPRSKAINHLIKTSETLSTATEIMQEYGVQGFTVQGKDPQDVEIVENYIHNTFPKGAAGYLNYLKQLAYGYYVEGGIASELINDDMGMPVKQVYVSPWTMAAELRDDPQVGEYYVYGQRQQGSNFDLKVLEDERDESKRKFIYLPANQKGDDPFGMSKVVAVLSSLTAMKDLVTNITNFMQGRVFPKHIYSLDTQAMKNAGFTTKQIAEAATLATDMITGKMSAADITQDIVMSVPIVATLVGALEAANLDGVDMVADIFERRENRGLGLPRVLYKPRSTGTSLNDSETRVDWLAIMKGLKSLRGSIEAVCEYHNSDVLAAYGSTGKVYTVLDTDDVELRRIFAELLKLEMEAYSEVKKLGVFTRKELRRKIIESQSMFGDLDVEMPDDPLLTVEDFVAINGLGALTKVEMRIKLKQSYPELSDLPDEMPEEEQPDPMPDDDTDDDESTDDEDELTDRQDKNNLAIMIGEYLIKRGNQDAART